MEVNNPLAASGSLALCFDIGEAKFDNHQFYEHYTNLGFQDSKSHLTF